MKPLVDEAMASAEEQMGQPVTTCVVLRHHADDEAFVCPMQEGRDVDYAEAMAFCRSRPSTRRNGRRGPAIYSVSTLGSTGKPKGVQHTVGGYMVYTATTHKYVFDYHDGDIYFCAADIGWITGHSYIIYGPLANGATTMMFGGIPTYPDAERYWQIIEAMVTQSCRPCRHPGHRRCRRRAAH